MADLQCDLGLLHKRWTIKKLETIGVNMPNRIDLTIFWTAECDTMTYYSMFQAEIEDMIMNYEWGNQALLFTFVKPETLRQWIWDQFCREPEEIVIDRIKY